MPDSGTDGGTDITASGDALSTEFTVQSSPCMKRAVAALVSWSVGEGDTSHLVIEGPPGSGRSHLLDALAEVIEPSRTIRCSPEDADWHAERARLKAEQGLRVLVDDFDGYDDQFRKQLLALAADRQHQLVATTKSFGGRFARIWEGRLGSVEVVRLEPLHLRSEDVASFIPFWARTNVSVPPDVSHTETIRLVTEMKLRRGFHDLEKIMGAVAASGSTVWDPPNSAAWMAAYTDVVVARESTRPVIFVEGRSDVEYFEWAARLTGATDEVDVEACQSASKIPPRAIAFRNSGGRCVALFDNDPVGRKCHEDMTRYELPSAVIANEYDPLKDIASDHLRTIVEIEDLLPTDDVARFFAESGRIPELVIEFPRRGLKRMVVHAEDKLELARWVGHELPPDSAARIIETYNALRAKLDLGPVGEPRLRSGAPPARDRKGREQAAEGQD